MDGLLLEGRVIQQHVRYATLHFKEESLDTGGEIVDPDRLSAHAACHLIAPDKCPGVHPIGHPTALCYYPNGNKTWLVVSESLKDAATDAFVGTSVQVTSKAINTSEQH